MRAKTDDGDGRPTPNAELAFSVAGGHDGRGNATLVLRGEFDLHAREDLRGALRAAVGAEGPTLVDLSGVTFLDVGCAKELALWRLLAPELLVPVAPSWQASATAVACGLAGERHLGIRRADAGTA